MKREEFLDDDYNEDFEPDLKIPPTSFFKGFAVGVMVALIIVLILI